MSEINEMEVSRHLGGFNVAKRKEKVFRFAAFCSGENRTNSGMQTDRILNGNFKIVTNERVPRGIWNYGEPFDCRGFEMWQYTEDRRNTGIDTKVNRNSIYRDYPAAIQPRGRFADSAAAKKKYIIKFKNTGSGTPAKQENPRGRIPRLALSGTAPIISDC